MRGLVISAIIAALASVLITLFLRRFLLGKRALHQPRSGLGRLVDLMPKLLYVTSKAPVSPGLPPVFGSIIPESITTVLNTEASDQKAEAARRLLHREKKRLDT